MVVTGEVNAPRGGVEAVSVNLVAGLTKREDLEFHMVTMDRACRAPTTVPWRGATVHRLPWTGRNVLTYAIGADRCQVQAYLAQLRHDVVHARDTYRLMVQGIRDRVMLLGSISAECVREELAATSVFALVSLEEGAPMGVAKAMAVGIPLVTSNRCGMPYVVRNGEAGYLVNPLDPDHIAARHTKILENESLKAAMGSKSRQIAEDRFRPDRVAARTRDVCLRAVRHS